ncbi:alpha/beta hydrolase [Marinobacter fonticola]|uniref:alpha/beta hydrolase n=1 Tax=Marinobacter fonticola TaxID=2603215 RepID=UPI0011E84F46|nr:hypothetical protein [Marinobacter fonticola]
MVLTEKLKRLATGIRNLPSLPFVLTPVDTSARWSEFAPGNYESILHFVHAARSLAFPVFSPFRQVPHLPYEVPEEDRVQFDDDQGWFFLNGICTDRNVLRLNGKALADLFGRKVYLMHNPSDGFALDIFECIIGRTMQLVSTLDTSVADILEDALKRYSKVVLIVHSQGGIISTAALYQLRNRLTGSRALLFNKLEVYSFASAATELDLPQVYAEHFYHTGDYVARIGVAANLDKFSGKRFTYRASGHLLNAHYLENFRAGKFLAKDASTSRLWSYLRAANSVEPAITVA